MHAITCCQLQKATSIPVFPARQSATKWEASKFALFIEHFEDSSHLFKYRLYNFGYLAMKNSSHYRLCLKCSVGIRCNTHSCLHISNTVNCKVNKVLDKQKL